MFIERLNKTFRINEPIFTDEILELFSDYSRVQVFRFIDAAKSNGELIQYSKGIYYFPEKTRFGYSTITAEDVIKKRYLKTDGEVCGIYGGIKLLNQFSITTQMAGIVEIVTNNESAKYREIQVNNRRFILRRSRCRIDEKNAAAYTVMQLFSDIENEDVIDDTTFSKLQGYIKKEGVTQSQLFSMAKVFPARATKNLIGSGIINGII